MIPLPKLSGFIQTLEQKCKQTPRPIILPEGDDPRVQEAAQYLGDSGAVSHVILLKEADALQEETREFLKKNYASKSKVVSEETLLSQSRDLLFQGATLLSQKYPDGACVAGANRTTADVIRAGLYCIGLSPGINTLSGAFFMVREQNSEQLLFTDCGVVADPTSEQLVEIAASGVELWKSFHTGEDPGVVFLSFSTKGSASHPSVAKVRQATLAFQNRYPKVLCDGEMQFDAAYVDAVRSKKAPDSPLKAGANIFVFPNLDSGNLGYKIAQRLGAFDAYGPILLGLRLPFSDLSRGASVSDIISSAYINLMRCGEV